LVPSPSRPTQKLAKVSVAVQVAAGSVQDADTLVNVPGTDARPDHALRAASGNYGWLCGNA
jgi:hypothetical protein